MKRMTIELSDIMTRKMEDIISNGYASSKIGVIRNALALYVYVIKEISEGNSLAITKDGKKLQLFDITR